MLQNAKVDALYIPIDETILDNSIAATTSQFIFFFKKSHHNFFHDLLQHRGRPAKHFF